MSTNTDLEHRVTVLEATVAELLARVAAPAPTANWLEQITGSVKDVEAFEEVLRLGRKFREADRPLKDGEAVP